MLIYASSEHSLDDFMETNINHMEPILMLWTSRKWFANSSLKQFFFIGYVNKTEHNNTKHPCFIHKVYRMNVVYSFSLK
jgi:hypothetical protein